MPLPQSNSQSAGLVGRFHFFWMMSQRTADGVKAQKMLFEGVRKMASSTSVTAAGRAVVVAGPPKPAWADGVGAGLSPPDGSQPARAHSADRAADRAAARAS